MPIGGEFDIPAVLAKLFHVDNPTTKQPATSRQDDAGTGRRNAEAQLLKGKHAKLNKEGKRLKRLADRKAWKAAHP